MKIVQLSAGVAVSAQIAPEDVATIAAAGYRVLINNRPDAEEAGQPAEAAIAAAARDAGLEYHYLPVSGLAFPGPHYEQIADLMDDPERPVLAFCRSGTRCTNLWVMSRAVAERRAAADTARQLGFDLSMAARHLD